MSSLIKLAAPQIQGQRRNRRTPEFLKLTGDRFKRARLEPAERRANDGSCIAMKLSDKRRYQSERMTAERTKETTDGNSEGIGQCDQAARVVSMPPKMTGLIAELATQRFRELLFLKTSKILVDLGFNQESVESTISVLGWTPNRGGSYRGFQLGKCIFQNNGFSTLNTLKTWMKATVTSITRHIIKLFTYYGVPTKVFNQAVKRNSKRFPKDFMFQLTREETFELLRSQFVTSNRGGRRYSPYAFTEQGVASTISMYPVKKIDTDYFDESI